MADISALDKFFDKFQASRLKGAKTGKRHNMALKGTKQQQKIKRLCQKSDQNQYIYFTLFSF